MTPSAKDDAASLRRKVMLGMLSHPTTLLPVLGGATALIGHWATGMGAPWVPFGGVAAAVVGAGLFVTRWLFGIEGATERALDELRREDRKRRDAELDELDRRLQEDGDWRTEKAFRRLRELAGKIQGGGALAGLNPASRIEVQLRVDELFEECKTALENALGLWERMQALESDSARAGLLGQREAEVAEVEACVETLERLYADGLTTSRGAASEGSLARIRAELSESLEVARRVESRMKSLEDGMGADAERAPPSPAP